MRERGRTVMFTGTTPNIGTTLLALGTAACLAAGSKQPVGYMCLNLKSSKLHRYLGKEDTTSALDSVRAEMRAGSLHARRLMTFFEPMKGQPNLQLLYGTLQREQAEFYQPGDIRHLIQAARDAYPVCFIETSAYWDNAATITAGMEADEKVLVTTPDLGHFQEDLIRGLKTVAPLFGIEPESFLLAVNQYKPGQTGGLKPSDIRKEAGMELAATIGFDPSLREWLNQGRLWEYITGNKAFLQAVKPLAASLSERLGLRLEDEAGERHSRARGWMPVWGSR